LCPRAAMARASSPPGKSMWAARYQPTVARKQRLSSKRVRATAVIERPIKESAPVCVLCRNFSQTWAGFSLGAAVKDSISFMSRPRKAMSEWVVHCEINQRHIRRSQPTKEAALKDACSQLLQGHAVNRIVGPNKTITAERVGDWCAKHRPSPRRVGALSQRTRGRDEP
jgi:hypothetical protein